MSILFFFSILGLIAFMFSGALVAINNKMNLGGVVFLAAITGLGGGTIRDILLKLPVFWMQNNWYLYLAVMIGVVTFCFYHTLKKYITRLFFEKTLDLFDVLGTASFMIMSVSTAKLNHQSTITSIVLSVITCIGGSVLRDIICGETSIIFKNDLYGFYATSVALGSTVYIAVDHYSTTWAIVLASLFLIGLRFSAIHFNLNLPRKSLS
ncbi:trimeric intracellular cation channel family protein [Legionella drancourtii]|uniref:Glycine transporter domain-containing protein n=1 Tax=Legionella drancourtii LLAP12 TaxID=658187 RepID=G9ELT6_9GAMM|nr:TRIC cation channel family protein [Legionella drancourtii]EHL31744.1 hypothetical protein LDG_6196 [Legionella drancourtii LLAP12]